jgi:hypothetical protein
VNDAAPQRVRVTSPRMGAPRRGPSRPIAREIGERTELGELYLSALIRAQRRLAIRVCLIASVCLGGLPILFALAPGIGSTDVLGLPVPWILLGVLAYPFLIILGWRAVVGAERNEREFAELVQPD